LIDFLCDAGPGLCAEIWAWSRALFLWFAFLFLIGVIGKAVELLGKIWNVMVDFLVRLRSEEEDE
tara:strand:+ start:980 stop:1174 length:195 start_codon:yes stop_codon:yes gene_type:complete